MQCNKNPKYSLKEKEVDYYCLLLTFRFDIPKEKRYQEDKRVVFVSQKDFPQYRKPETQKAIGWTELEILHDPTITPDITEKPQQGESTTLKPPAERTRKTKPK